MSWIAVAVGGGSLIGGLLSGMGSQSAAGEQASAAQNATNTQQGMFNTVMGNLAPYQQAGGGALNQLEGGLNASQTGGPGGQAGFLHAFGPQDLQTNLAPNYGWGLAQGQGQVQNAAAASGGAFGGNAEIGLNSFTQDYAQNAYQNAFNNYQTQQNNIYGRLGNLAQLGQASATGSASGAPMFASGISNSLIGIGNAQAAGTMGMANAVSGGIGNIGSSFLLSKLLNNPTPGGGPG